ncbi:hypothetical protein HY449_01485 [Candidatus Pacearchaeota archaeon]|nr:hypothetical protein [Candidatus Pacearchaeota archaeon]
MKNEKRRDSDSSIFSKSKRGQGLSVNAIILIVLGLFVLVILLLGFTVGWSNILPFISTNNVDKIATACELACSTGSQFDFCNLGRNINTDDRKFKETTCNYVSQNQAKYGIETCQTIACQNVAFVTAANKNVLPNLCSGNQGKTIQALIGDTLESYDCPA